MKKFLIIHLYSNGDCLYATTLAKQLKHDYPECYITWAVAPFCADILLNNPFIDEIWRVDYLPDRDPKRFRENRKRLWSEAATRNYDRIFFTQIIEENIKYYDGLVRSSIHAAFQYPIAVDKKPVLTITNVEKEKVADFIRHFSITDKNFVILFECAPQSGQLSMDIERARVISEKILKRNPSVKIILSSAQKVEISAEGIVDGSLLNLRETAHLTHYCDLLIGCSSGITWATTSTSAKELPSIQLLDRDAYIFNSPVLDYKRNGWNENRWLELYSFDDNVIENCINSIIYKGFSVAHSEFSQPAKQKFRIYRGITHSLLQKGRFGSLLFFVKRNIAIHGYKPEMLMSIFKGVLFFPAQWILNKLNKKII